MRRICPADEYYELRKPLYVFGFALPCCDIGDGLLRVV
jgi:hypothetical protein